MAVRGGSQANRAAGTLCPRIVNQSAPRWKMSNGDSGRGGGVRFPLMSISIRARSTPKMGPSVSRAFGIRLAEPKWPINNWLLCSAGRLHSLRAGGRRKKNAKVKDARARTHARPHPHKRRGAEYIWSALQTCSAAPPNHVRRRRRRNGRKVHAGRLMAVNGAVVEALPTRHLAAPQGARDDWKPSQCSL